MACYFNRNSLDNKKNHKRRKKLIMAPEREADPCALCGEASVYCTTRRKDDRYVCENCYRKKYILNEATRKKWLWEHKAENGCVLCEEDDPRCLDYHHMDPSKKKFSIGSVSSSIPNSAFEIEIRKCVVICANCHRKVEAALK